MKCFLLAVAALLSLSGGVSTTTTTHAITINPLKVAAATTLFSGGGVSTATRVITINPLKVAAATTLFSGTCVTAPTPARKLSFIQKVDYLQFICLNFAVS